MEFFPLGGSSRNISQLEERDLLQRVGKCSNDEHSGSVDCTLSLGFSSSPSATGTDVKSMTILVNATHTEHYTRRCLMCGTTQTPLWRNGPNGAKSLCNACGIRLKKEERRASLLLPSTNSRSKKPEADHESSALTEA